MYVWDPSADGGDPDGAYHSANGSTFGDSNDRIIAPFQGFFVEGGSSGGTFSISDVSKAQAASDGLFRTAISSEEGGFEFQLTLDSLVTDATVMWWENHGRLEKDPYDTYRFYSMNRKQYQIQLYSLLDDGTGLDIQTLPMMIQDSVEVPLAARASGCVDGNPLSGTATLSWPTMENVSTDWAVHLVDHETGETIDPRSRDRYQFELAASDDCSGSTSKTYATSTTPLPEGPQPIRTSNRKSSSPATRFALRIVPSESLPVELTDFDGTIQGDDVILRWKTVSESNNAGFHVQHRVEASGATDATGERSSFENVAFVNGAGTTERPRSYRYNLSDLDAGEHTLRLQQVDADGSTSNSDPIRVDVGLSGAYSLATYPNPIQDRATIEFAVSEQEDVKIELFNTLGQQVKTLYRGTPAAEQTRRLSFDGHDLPSGLYFVRVQGSGFTATKRITVVH